MFKHILVPLDGSQRAEQALPLAAHLAHTFQSTIVLLQAVELLTTYGMQPPGGIESFQEMEEEAAKDYLLKVKNVPLLEQTSTTTEVYVGNAASAIIEACKAYNIDIVVLFSHGHTGLKQWVLGSIAQKIARSSSVPVLIQRDEHPLPFAYTNEKEPVFHVCVALDGSQQAETILEPALSLALACSPAHRGEVHLLRIVEPLSQADEEAFQRYYQVDIQRVICQPAQAYIEQVVTRLKQKVAEYPDMAITGTVKTGTDVAHELMQYTEHGQPDQQVPYQFLAMTTHGRGNFERWMLGSVAERVLNRTRLPLLIVCPQEHPYAESQRQS